MTQLSTSYKDYHLKSEIVQEILDAVASIDYGSVEIVIHDSKVVQIECRKKIRVNQSGSSRKALDT